MTTKSEYSVEYQYPPVQSLDGTKGRLGIWRVEARFDNLHDAQLAYRHVAYDYTTKHLSWRIVVRSERVVDSVMRHLGLVVNNE